MEFLTDFGKKNYEAQEKQRKMMLYQAQLYNENTQRHQDDVNDSVLDRMRIEAMGKLTPFGNEAFTSGNRAFDYNQNREIIQAYISTHGIPKQMLPARFSTGGQIGLDMMGGRIDIDSLIPVLDQASFSLVEEALRRNQDNYEQNDLIAQYNDDQISETELEGIQTSKTKVLDILRGITAKLTAGIKQNSEAFGLSMMNDLQSVYQELLNWGYGYNREDLERIRVYLEEEPALIRIDVGSQRSATPVNKLALDILNRIVKPMLSSQFVGTMKEKKLLMEPIIESFYKTIDPSESGNHIPPKYRVEAFDDVNSQFEAITQIFSQMEDLERRQGTQQTQRVQNDLMKLKKSFDDRAERLYGTLVSYAMGDIYNQSEDEVTRATNDFNVLPAQRKIEVLQSAINEFDWDEQEVPPSYPPEMYEESEMGSLPFSLVEGEVEEPLRMPELPAGEQESKEETEEQRRGEFSTEEMVQRELEPSYLRLLQKGVDEGDLTPEQMNELIRQYREQTIKPRPPQSQSQSVRPRGRPRGSKNRPKEETRSLPEKSERRLAPTQRTRKRQQEELARQKEEEEATGQPEEEVGAEAAAQPRGRGRGRKTKKSSDKMDRKRLFKSSQVKPETFKKFIKMVMTTFDDSNIKRI
jgi:hypothetical protein